MNIEIENLCKQAAASALKLAATSSDDKNKMLEVIANALVANEKKIIEQNALDMAVASTDGKDGAFLDRLALTPKRIANMAEGFRQVMRLPDPIGEIVSEWKTEAGLDIKMIRVPLGVVAIIYEARPNVTADAASLCIKSGNAVILKGSQHSHNSNKSISDIMKKALEDNGFDSACIVFIDDRSRESTAELLKMDKYVDVAIPRGGNGLKKFVLDHSSMPVIASAGGNCHLYVEKTADFKMALDILINAKCQRPSVCNAVEQLLVDEAIAKDFLPMAYLSLTSNNVAIRGDEKSREICPMITAATEADYETEMSNLTLTIKVVSGYSEAIDRINKYGTKHSEAIISSDTVAVNAFMSGVDAACLYHNASTRFTDGFEFGFGAEMAISTQKLHVRGPVGLIGLTSEKYVIVGNGTIRK